MSEFVRYDLALSHNIFHEFELQSSLAVRGGEKKEGRWGRERSRRPS